MFKVQAKRIICQVAFNLHCFCMALIVMSVDFLESIETID